MKTYLTLLFSFCLLSGYAQPLTEIPMPSGYSNFEVRFRNDVKIDNSNNTWVAFETIGLGKYDGSAWTIYNESGNMLLSDQVFDVDIDSSGHIYAATAGGLSVYNGTSWTGYDSGNSTLPADGATCVRAASLNTVWAGSNEGLHYYNGSIWQSYNSATSGLGNDSVTCITFGMNGEIVTGTKNGIYVFYQGSWTSLPSTLPDNRITRIAVDNGNRIWLTTFSGESYRYNATAMVYSSFASMLPIPEYGCTYFGTQSGHVLENNGDILVGTPDPHEAGLLFVRSDTGNVLTYKNFRSPATIVSDLLFDFKGNKVAVLFKMGITQVSSRFYVGDLSTVLDEYLDSYFFEPMHLNVNNVNARINNTSEHHWDPVTQVPHYQVPACSGKNVVYTSGLWLGGLDQNNILHTAAMTYSQNNSFDFWAGPLDTTTGTTNFATVEQYDRLWKVNKSTIIDFIYNFQQGNVANGSYIIPEVLLKWPAHGTGNFSRQLAPFHDENSDGLYNPYDGDYPVIEGDQQIWFVFNDAYDLHTQTGGPAFGFEIHGKAYAYRCDSAGAADVINNTTFYQYKIINRSSNTYHNTTIGFWVDNDLGNASDDHVMCNVPLNTGICLNGDNDDEGFYGYGLKPPFQNITILKGPPAPAGDGMDNDNDGTIDESGETIGMGHFMKYNNINNSADGNPVLSNDYYNYMNSNWLDSLPLTYGENGRNQSNPPANFIFPGSSDPSFSALPPWTMQTEGIPGGDMRYLLSTGHFTIAPGEEKTIDFAYIYSRDTVGTWPADAESKNLDDISKVLYWFNNNMLSDCQLITGTEEIADVPSGLMVYPNPSKEYIEILNLPAEKDLFYSLSDINGKIVQKGQIQSSRIEIKNLQAGLYFIHVESDKVLNGKFVKME